MKKYAFTLAEVMIVVVIIGVVAIFTMPVLISEVTERVNSNRQANIVQKVTKAVELMIVGGDYEGFQTTDEFVDKLQKYLKIVKRCDYNNIAKCWPSNSVTISDGSKYNVANATTGIELHTNNNTKTVGLVLADGGNIILTYNPEAIIPNADAGFKATKKALPIGGGKTKEFSYTSNATDAIDFVMDVNGATGPNAETDDEGHYYDIRSFRIASFSTAGCPGFKHNGICVYDMKRDYNSISCGEGKNSTYCGGNTDIINYFAGAKKACADKGLRLASTTEFKNIYNDTGKIPADTSYITTGNMLYYETARNIFNTWATRTDTKYNALCVR